MDGGAKVHWSLLSASMFCWPLRLVIPLSVAIRSRKAFTIASAGVTMGCVMYLCLKYTVSDRLSVHVALIINVVCAIVLR